jgi:PAS domain S-box-containing protein
MNHHELLETPPPELGDLASQSLAAVLEACEDAIIGIDPKGVIASWNPGAERILGYRAGTMIGRRWIDLVPADRVARDQELLECAWRGERIDRFETARRHEDGGTIEIASRITPLRTASGAVVRAIEVARDNGFRKRFEKELIESEMRKSAIVQQALDCIITIDHQGRILDFNPAAEHTFGYRREEVLDAFMSDLIMPPRFRAAHHGGLERYLATGEGPVLGKRIELTAMRSDGVELPIEIAITVIKRTGSPVFTACMRDLTERKRHERNVAVHQAVTQALVESSTVEIVVSRVFRIFCEQLGWLMGNVFEVDRNSQVLRFAHMWHVEDARLDEFARVTRQIVFAPAVGMPGRVWVTRAPAWIPDLRLDDNFLRRPEALSDGLRSGIAFPIIVDGEVSGVVEFYADEPRREDAELLALMADLGHQIGQFIERKRAEAALRGAKEAAEIANFRLRERVRLLALGEEIGVVLVEGASLTATLQMCADAIVRHFDVPCARIWTLSEDGATLELKASAGVDNKITGPLDTIPVGQFEIGRIAQTREPAMSNFLADDPESAESSWAKRHGLVMLAGHPLVVDGSVVGVVAMFASEPFSRALFTGLSSAADTIALGISRKRTEIALVQSEAAALAASRAKSEFLANMSHEIRTPMNGVLGMLELALDTTLTSRQRDYLEVAHRSAESLLSILNDVLDFSKIEAGKLALDIIPFSVRECVQNVVADMSVRARGKDLALKVDLARDLPETFLGDPGRLRQVLLNLVSNAIKFTEKGEVVVAARPADSSDDGVWIQFEVRDTGIGIKEDHLARIFKPFEQADTSTTRTHGGTGLGITISARLVAMMSGRLEVMSEPGKGSTFHFQARLAAPAAPAPTASSSRFLNGTSVLIAVENNSGLSKLRELLEISGARPTCVTTGREAACAIFESGGALDRFPIAVIDADAKLIDGWAIAQMLIRDRARDVVVVMLISPDAKADSIARCHSMGISSPLVKPATPTQIIDKIVESTRDETAVDRPRRRNRETIHHEPAIVTPIDAPDFVTAGARAAAGVRILLAEDNKVNQAVTSAMLESQGFEIMVVDNGLDAIEAIERQSYDVILMDLQMPVMDGLTATKRIRQMERDGHSAGAGRIPIIALTAHAIKGDRELCLEAGMDEYLTKPINRQELLRAIENCLTRRTPAPRRTVSPVVASRVGSFLDTDVLRERFDGDAAAFTENLRECGHTLNNLLAELELAQARGDFSDVALISRRLEGSLGNLTATEARDAALRAVEVCQCADHTGLEDAIERLKIHTRGVARAINTLLAVSTA